MKRIAESDSAADWIRPFLFGSPKASRTIPQVGDFVPACFEGYCRLLHTTFLHQAADDQIEPEAVPGWYGTRMHAPLAITRRELARRHGIKFDGTSTTRDIIQKLGHKEYDRLYTGPELGYIVPMQLEVLIGLLRASGTETGTCYYYYDVEAVGLGEARRLYTGTLDDYAKTWDMEDVLSSPTYAWPASRDWLVCSLEPCDFSMICGGASLIEALVSDPELECLEVDLCTPIRREGSALTP